VRNLIPVVQGDRAAAEKAACALFRNFARKLADLWRFEAGFAPSFASARLEGWEHLVAAHARGQGVLLIGPHLGNWEVGSVLLAERGLKLVIISLAEPGEDLTALRTASRVQWDVETLVIGQDAFAFVEVIKRLQQGAIMAVLIDRPKEAGAVTVEFFGTPFQASPGAAELARASGCALLGVTVVRHGDGYSTRALPEFTYDRRALGSREARGSLPSKSCVHSLLDG
jgi:KDO2-lipid IV(A) lauroyltransferase